MHPGAVLAELLGLNTTAVIQLNGLEQPINKETILDVRDSDPSKPSQDVDRLYYQIMRGLVKFVVTNPTKKLATVRVCTGYVLTVNIQP